MKRFSPVFLDSGYIGGYMGQNRGKWRRNGGTKAARDWDIQQRKERGMWACFPNVIKCRKPGRLNADPRAPALTINPLLTVCVCRFGRYVTEHSQRSNIALSNPSTPLLCLQYISHCFSPILIRSTLTCFSPSPSNSWFYIYKLKSTRNRGFCH